MSANQKFGFYHTVRDVETARIWHQLNTPWFSESEIEYIINEYDYDEIKNIYKNNYLKNNNFYFFI